MRAIVTCEGCGYRQMVARQLDRPEAFHVICHGCERTLLVTVTAIDMRTARTRGLVPAPRLPAAPGRAA
ncbi:MAG TPA: hypothetical protein VMW47_12550 [Verrucomicrobiae bacterium]|nr:hypothetical protein [Verrucomicrobiae bacterium]